MVQVRCPSCSKSLNVPDQYAGRKVKCPGCQAAFAVPGAAESETPLEVTPIPTTGPRPAPPPIPDMGEEEPAAVPPGRRPRPADEEYDEPTRRRSRDDDNYDDPRLRRRPYRRSEQWAPCPYCGCADATRVYWTVWGSWIGPLFINQVRCNDCGTNYNGKHGDYNSGRIAVYLVISVFGVLFVVAAFIALMVLLNQ
jgi:hypothetical protein